MNTFWKWIFFINCVLLINTAACSASYQTKNVIIAVLQGVRYSETFGDFQHANIPHLWKELKPQGTLYTNCWNAGVTGTRQGHSSIITGTWQYAYDDGPRMTMPSVFDYLRDELAVPQEKTWAIFGNGRSAWEEYSSFPSYGNRFRPRFECGIGSDSKDDDWLVFKRLQTVMDQHKPSLVFLSLGYTNNAGYGRDMQVYTDAIKNADTILAEIWYEIQSHPDYQDKTTYIIINDHGRHDDKHGGYRRFGDSCEGCRHVMCLILGPDTRKGIEIAREVRLIDIAPTVGELLGVQTPLVEGATLEDSFIRCYGNNRKEGRTATAIHAIALEKLANRPLIQTVADAAIARRRPAETPVNTNTELLMRGLITAFDVTGNDKYIDYVLEWASKVNVDGDPIAALCLGSVQAELARRTRQRYLWDAAIKSLEQGLPVIGGQPNPDETPLLCAMAARISRYANDKRQPKEVANRLMAHVESLKAGGDTAWNETKDSLLLNGLVEVATACPDDHKLSAIFLLHAARILKQMPEVGGVWKDTGNSALNIYSLTQARRLNWWQAFRWSRDQQDTVLPEVLDTMTEAQKAELEIADGFGNNHRQQSQARRRLAELMTEHGRNGLPFSLNQLRYQVDINGRVMGDEIDRATGAFLLAKACLDNSQLRPRTKVIRTEPKPNPRDQQRQRSNDRRTRESQSNQGNPVSKPALTR